MRRRLGQLSNTYSEQLAAFVQRLPNAAHVDLQFLLFRLETGGTRVTEDGSSRRSSET